MIQSPEVHAAHSTRHGSAWDRGSADSYYGRDFDAHLFRGASYQSQRVVLADMTADEIADYTAGYRHTAFAQKHWD